MRVSKLFGETLRQSPGNDESNVFQLLVRAGYFRQTATGQLVLMPLAWRSLQKIERLIRNIFDTIHGQEMLLPLCFQKNTTGAEALVAQLCVSEIRSYRQLPQLLYQFRYGGRGNFEKINNTPEKRGQLQQNAFSLDRTETELAKHYQIISTAFHRFFTNLNLPVSRVIAESRFGGKHAQAFVYFSPAGAEEIVICSNCDFAAKRTIAPYKKEIFVTESLNPLKKVATPQTGSISSLSNFLGIDSRQTAKIVFYTGRFGAEKPEKLIICVIRGDMETSDALVRQISGAQSLRTATTDEIIAVGCVPGFASPIGITHDAAVVVVDELVTRSPNLVTGANEVDSHFLNSNYGRDYQADLIGNITLAPKDARCVTCNNVYQFEKCVEIASLDTSEDFFSNTTNAVFLDEKGKPQPIHLGSYAIDLGKLLFCLADEYHDSYGLTLPPSVAPFDVALVVLKGDEVAKIADRLYRDLREADIAVLFDDRFTSPGVKFKDADLRGIPLRITVSERALQQGGVEFKLRTQKERSIVPLKSIADKLKLFLQKISLDAEGNYS